MVVLSSLKNFLLSERTGTRGREEGQLFLTSCFLPLLSFIKCCVVTGAQGALCWAAARMTAPEGTGQTGLQEPSGP